MRWHRYKCENCHKTLFQMYIIACRAICHLLGLGQVGHSPRGTSGSAGTLDWGPMWSGSQSTFHPQYTSDTPTPTRSPQYPLMPIPLLTPEYLESLLAPNTSLTPPMFPKWPLHPLEPPMPPIPFWLLST